jgi:hypothetical protein
MLHPRCWAISLQGTATPPPPLSLEKLALEIAEAHESVDDVADQPRRYLRREVERRLRERDQAERWAAGLDPEQLERAVAAVAALV